MTIKEEKLMRNYIENLVRESLYETNPESFKIDDRIPDDDETPDYEEVTRKWERNGGQEEDDPQGIGPEPDDFNEFWHEHDHPEARRSKYEGPDVSDEPDYEPAGLDELRKLCEGFARGAVESYLNESKKKSSKKTTRSKDGKKKGSKEKKISSSEKTLMDRLNSDGVNAASYYYKLYGAKTDAEKAAARSKGYKKAKAKKNDTGAHYKFSSKERNRLNALLSDK